MTKSKPTYFIILKCNSSFYGDMDDTKKKKKQLSPHFITVSHSIY